MTNYDVYGNVDRYALFYDARTNDLQWYPATYANHPIWAQYLTEQIGYTEDTTIYPSSTLFPSVDLFLGKFTFVSIPDITRPPGMHGIGTK